MELLVVIPVYFSWSANLIAGFSGKAVPEVALESVSVLKAVFQLGKGNSVGFLKVRSALGKY